MENERNTTIDCARGIAILLVVFGHCCYSLDDPINKVILSFHMPLFFFLSGLVSKTYDAKIGGRYLLRKIKTILLPQLLLGFITYTYDFMFIIFVKKGNAEQIDLIYCIWRWWFLPVLFVVSVLFYYISKCFDFKRINVKIGIVLIDSFLIFLTVYIIPFPDESPFYLNVAPMAFMFYFLGYLCKPFLSIQLNSKLQIGAAIAGVVLLVICSQINSHVTMYNNEYGNILLFLTCCICGIFSVWHIANNLNESKMMKWLGMNSIVVYVWQFKITEFYKNIAEILGEKIWPSLYQHNLFEVCIAFALSLISLIPIVVISDKFFPFLYGKGRK